MICRNHPEVTEGVVYCSRCQYEFCQNCVITLSGRPYCGQCKVEQIADVRSGVDATQLPLAGLGRRLLASWVDWFVLAVPFLAVIFLVFGFSVFTDSDPDENWGLTLITWAAYPVFIAYEALMLSARGQTLGKMALGLRVVSAGGTSLTSGQAWGRAVVRGLMVSLLALVNYLPAFFTKEKTCVHDMAAKTRVIRIA